MASLFVQRCPSPKMATMSPIDQSRNWSNNGDLLFRTTGKHRHLWSTCCSKCHTTMRLRIFYEIIPAVKACVTPFFVTVPYLMKLESHVSLEVGQYQYVRSFSDLYSLCIVEWINNKHCNCNVREKLRNWKISMQAPGSSWYLVSAKILKSALKSA